MESILLENPLALGITLIGLAVVLRLVATHRRHWHLKAAVLLAILAGTAVIGLGVAVTTDRERLLERTEQLIKATAPLDLSTVKSLLHPNVTLRGPDGALWLRASEIQRQLDRVIEQFGIDTHKIPNIGVEVSSNQSGRSLFDLRTKLNVSGVPISTVWELVWSKDPDGQWRVAEAHWLKFQEQAPTRGLWHH